MFVLALFVVSFRKSKKVNTMVERLTIIRGVENLN